MADAAVFVIDFCGGGGGGLTAVRGLVQQQQQQQRAKSSLERRRVLSALRVKAGRAADCIFPSLSEAPAQTKTAASESVPRLNEALHSQVFFVVVVLPAPCCGGGRGA